MTINHIDSVCTLTKHKQNPIKHQNYTKSLLKTQFSTHPSNEFYAIPFQHQAAGHGSLIEIPTQCLINHRKFLSKKDDSFLSTLLHCIDDGHTPVCKPVQDSFYSSEKAFYQYVQDHPSWKPFVPKYYGTVCLPSELIGPSYSKELKSYLVLENLTSKYEKPCIMDVKMGTNKHIFDGKRCSPEKVERHEKRTANSTSSSLGFRICGFKTWCPQLQEYIHRDASYGLNLYSKEIEEPFRKFFNMECDSNLQTISQLLDHLHDIQSMFQKQTQLRFYSSSLLIIYEGCPNVDHPPSVDLRMVDFAHVYSTSSEDIQYYGLHDHPSIQPGYDRGYLYGLKNLIQQLSKLI
eukprot:gb/GECH01003358.1/.p1 GENE.gb/GECH01003358.1/~~gb/GECH01003358.1/.p1  ORF type:complete len:348 (+),score=93.62 gb/GECH01003358.1/:1-1044(+)